ncbi:hypothetical protein GLOIN_2v1709588 [Rhizophagus clarus]|uniref:Uncharacterized protein n=1 Tax=Rhizophagus clarus TaxID=94130 RepID=A0A8H3QKB6_9GLOM|nr:hypothetical protein GLOIN_2v1709588 [Rhizophagus clarus]
MQAITINSSSHVSALETAIQDRPMDPQTPISSFFPEEAKADSFNILSLKEVLAKYGIGSDGTETIPLFSPETHEVQDSNKHFEHCIENILFRMKNYRSLVLDSLESMRNEYVLTILHTALHIAGDIVSKEFSMKPEYEIIGDESCERVDYTIKEAKNLICITEDKASELPFTIEFNKKALDKDLEEYVILRKGVLKVLSIIKQTLQSACEAPQWLTVNDNSSNNSSPSFNSVAVLDAITIPTNSAKCLNGKSLEEKDMDSCLLEAHKKIVSDEIRQRKREEKLQRESTVASPSYNSEKNDQVISEISGEF